MDDRVKVIISVDAEFTINSAFTNPKVCLPSSTALFSPIPNNSIGFKEVLNLLNKHQVKATFFTEALNAHFFGIDQMKKHVKQMLIFNHDVQLHAHPVWQEFKNLNWKDNVVNKKLKDNFFGMTSNEIQEVLNECIEIFCQWTGVKPIAFRAGNLNACPLLYDALEKTNFILASNIGLPIYSPKEESLHVENKAVVRSNIIELPVTSYKSMGFRNKALTITGTSSKEIKDILRQCRSKGIEYVVVLTHIHEFIKTDSTSSRVKSDRTNLRRLDDLCLFVNNDDGFEFETFGNLFSLDKESLEQSNTTKDIKTSFLSGLWTILENKINEKIWFY